MANTTDRVTVELITNDSQTRSRLESLRKLIEECGKKKDEAFNMGDMRGYDKYRKEMESARRELEGIQTKQKTIEHTLKEMDKATPKELRETIRKINALLNSGDVERGSEQWKRLTSTLRQCNKEMREIKEESQAAQSTILEGNPIARFGQRWVGLTSIITQASSAISTAYDFMGRYVDEYAELAEHMASVTKYTGLAKEDVDDLNESFKKMDTRTSQAALNDLAADAGRLGIQGKQEILDFVDAADQINIALGEDLGEGAVKEIGKLAQMFGDADTMGLKKAMLATGSTINELAQNSSAAEGYIMEFTSRIAGMGKTAGMTQSQIMGLASVMSQNKVQAEQGSTALSHLIQVMYREPAKMAQAAGMDVQNFCSLVKTDANEAILQFAQAVSQLGGMDKIAPMLAELSLTGQGVSTVIATLAKNTDLVRESQEQANQAFQEATSVTNEANVANNTVQANLEKIRKKCVTLRSELGEQLMPVQVALTNTVLGFLTVLMKAGKFLASHKTILLSLAAATATYYAAVNIALAKEKLHTVAILAKKTALTAVKAAQIAAATATALLSGNITRATAALRIFNTTLKASPWGLVAAAASFLASTIADYVIKTREAVKATKEAQETVSVIRQQAAQQAEEERQRIEELVKTARDENASLRDRKTAVSELNKIIPSYNAKIDETTGKYKENKKALDAYILSLQKKYEIEGAKETLRQLGQEKAGLLIQQEITKAAIKDQKARQKAIDNAASSSWGAGTAGATMSQLSGTVIGGKISDLNDELSETNSQLSAIEKKRAAITKLYGNDLKGKPKKSGESKKTEEPKGPNQPNNPPQSKVNQEEAALLAQKILYEKGLQTLKQYEQNCHDIRQSSILRQQKKTKEGSAQWLKLESERLENDKKLREQHRAWSEEQIEADEKQEKLAAEQSYLTGQLTYEQYQQKLNEIHLSYLAQRLNLARQNAAANQSPDTQKALSEAQAAYDEEDRRQQVERQEATLKEVNALKQKYLKLSDEEKMQAEITALDALHQQGLISEEEYQKMLLAIKKQYGEAGANAQKKWYDSLAGINFQNQLTSQIMATITAIGQLSDKLKDGEASWGDYAAVAAASLSAVSSMLTSATNLVKANMQIEIKKVEERYDAEIEAAGSSTKKGQKLQEQKEKEVAKIKNKYNKRAMTMQIAQATAESIMGAISAYTSVMKGVPYPANLILAPVAAGIAMAAGAANIALIAKQQQAQAAGFYSGGFTGGSDPRKPAGIVHQKEFVVNAQAVANPALSPFLNLIDQAQRNNTVATLNPLAATTAAAALPVQSSLSLQSNQSNQSEEKAAAALTSTLARLADQLEQGITAYAQIDGQNGVARQLARYNRLSNR